MLQRLLLSKSHKLVTMARSSAHGPRLQDLHAPDPRLLMGLPLTLLTHRVSQEQEC